MMNNELYHYGVLGQKWGVRRYQNEDGTLTSAGKRRYRAEQYSDMSKFGKMRYDHDKKKFDKDIKRADDRMFRRERYLEKKANETKNYARLGTMSNIRNSATISKANKHTRDQSKFFNENPDQKQRLGRITKRQRIATIAGGSTVALGSAVVAAQLASSAAVGLLPAAVVAAGSAYVYNLTRR